MFCYDFLVCFLCVNNTGVHRLNQYPVGKKKCNRPNPFIGSIPLHLAAGYAWGHPFHHILYTVSSVIKIFYNTQIWSVITLGIVGKE